MTKRIDDVIARDMGIVREKKEIRDERGRFGPGNNIGPHGRGYGFGASLLQQLSESALRRAFEVLYELMDREDTNPAHRIAAIQILFERGAGKVTQKVDIVDRKPMDAPLMTGAQLEQALQICAQTRADMRALTQGRSVKDILSDEEVAMEIVRTAE